MKTLKEKAEQIKEKMEELRADNPSLTEGQLRILAVRTIAMDKKK